MMCLEIQTKTVIVEMDISKLIKIVKVVILGAIILVKVVKYTLTNVQLVLLIVIEILIL